MNEADHRIGLRKVAPEFTARRIEVFGQKANMITARKEVLKELTRLLAPADRSQRLDVPEAAHDEGVAGRPKSSGLP